MTVISKQAPDNAFLNDADVQYVVRKSFSAADYRGKRVLVIVPDGTRSGPIDVVFRALAEVLGPNIAALDVLVALGTHQPMSEAAMCERIGLSAEDRAGRFSKTKLFNHAWDDPGALQEVGTISADEINTLSGGLFSMDVVVEINKRVFDYDQTIIIGPVFPHEVVGFSGGNKYLFPGIAGPRLLNFFHWLGAVVTNPRIIGHANTPVRSVVDKAAALVNVDKRCLSLVVEGRNLAGIFCGSPEEAWAAATPLSEQRHIVTVEKPFHTIVSCLPPMYEDLWTGGKGMYKMEPALADGGEVILLGPHIKEVSVTHNKTMLAIGYHCRDYFLQQWDKFSHHPWGVIAHSTHVRGGGVYEGGVESCRVQVTAATQLSRQVCESINLSHRDPVSIDIESYADRESEGIFLARKAGEKLYRLANAPDWARSFGLASAALPTL